jgi:cytochrome c peroxidase
MGLPRLTAAQAPPTLQPPPVPAENPNTPSKALLGKILFWDEQVSSHNTMACGGCHRAAAGGGGSSRRHQSGTG